jgi:hypothetical protein
MNMPKKKSKGFSMSFLWQFAMALVVLGIVTAVGAIILSNFRTTICPVTGNCVDNVSYQFNLTTKAIEGVGEFGNWFKIIAIAGIAGVVLGLVLMFLVPKMQQGGV